MRSCAIAPPFNTHPPLPSLAPFPAVQAKALEAETAASKHHEAVLRLEREAADARARIAGLERDLRLAHARSKRLSAVTNLMSLRQQAAVGLFEQQQQGQGWPALDSVGEADVAAIAPAAVAPAAAASAPLLPHRRPGATMLLRKQQQQQAGAVKPGPSVRGAPVRAPLRGSAAAARSRAAGVDEPAGPGPSLHGSAPFVPLAHAAPPAPAPGGPADDARH